MHLTILRTRERLVRSERGKMVDTRKMLEEDRKKFRDELAQAGEPADAVDILSRELDRILFRLSTADDDHDSPVLSRLAIRTAKGALPLVDSCGEVEVFQKLESGKTGVRREEARWYVLLPFGILSGCIAAFLPSWGPGGAVLGVIGFLLTLICAGLCFFSGLRFAGYKKRRRSQGGPRAEKTYRDSEFRTVVHPDPEKICHHMSVLLQIMDESIAAARKDLEAEISALPGGERPGGGPSDAACPDLMSGRAGRTVSLLSDLLEDVYALKDTPYGAEMLTRIQYYLHADGIEIQDYRSAGSGLGQLAGTDAFELVPGECDETIRPALIRNGKVIRRGMAVRND